MKIKCLVIDDERLAREYLKNYIGKIPELELLGDFNSPLKATELIKKGDVDLIFIDIQMPDITGIDFIRSLSNKPEIIFTTAYQEYALEGFNLNVTDYLLKPFSFDRFFQAVNKVIDKLENQSNTNEQSHLVEQSLTSYAEDYLTIRADRKLYKINFSDIKYIEGQKAYVTFHTDKKRITALASLKELEEALPSNHFIRIHKSFIVSIHEILSLEGNMMEVGEVKLPVGKIYKEAVLKVFGVE
ncbi:LytR/AlgR family response regulator transcription factor [Saccharicrinis fermentans]|uniref:Sensory transduction protein LytR n=1 Tax=Saccharicrinis fermentans DSM 9555 = JCM 21142 TaxID=869213 RepID=W7Y4D3_9BACT|nr:LytTR family DNA-binding domain-containing protein [Saccharicrinis fermentans]GAF05750.1 sensory transduction protein LytR [Saccharicrinis fermentans DSM 9555 = JCM 21142]